MLRMLFAALLALGALAAGLEAAEARTRRAAPVCDNVDVMRPCQVEIVAARGDARGQRALKRGGRDVAVAVSRARPGASQGLGLAAAGLVAPLAAKVAEIQGACRASLISGVRHTRIAGTRTMSLHAQGKAADMAGDAVCIYGRLAGWAGGYSVDYGRMRHVHISWDPEGGREMGLRFHHGGGRKHARRHHQRLARR